MTSAALHPFIGGNKVYGIRRDAPAPAVAQAPAYEQADYDYEEISGSNILSNKFFWGAIVAGLLLVSASGYAIFSNLESEITQNAPLAPGAKQIELKPATFNGNIIPEGYPGIYPGEQRVIYQLAPMANEATTTETDEDGCQWLRVTGKTEGIMVYPLIGDDGKHVCTDPTKAIQPETARMIKDTVPNVPGSTLRIIDIKDAATGRSLLNEVGYTDNSMPFVPTTQLAAQSATQTPQQMSPQLAQATQPQPTRVSSIPSQAAPYRYAPISTASDASARMPAPRQTSSRPTQAPRSQPTPLEPIRRAPAYVPPDNDKMVSLSGGAGPYAGDEQVSISGNSSTRDLRAIKPGDPPALPGQKRSEIPGGSPLEGYGSISGK